MSGAAAIWAVILGLGLISALIRCSFLALLRNAAIPPRVREALGFVPVTVLPALVAPMIVLAPRTDEIAEPHRMLAALAALAAGMTTRSMVATVAAGVAAFVLFRWLGL